MGERIRKEFYILKKGIKLSNEYRGKSFLWLVTADKILGIIEAYLSIYMSGELITMITSKDVIFKNAVIYAAITVGSVFVCSIIRQIIHRSVLIMRSSGEIKYNAMLSKKALSLDYEDAEKNEISELRAKLNENSQMGNGISNIAEQISEIISDIISVIISIVIASKTFLTNKQTGGNFDFSNSYMVSIILIVFTFVLIFVTIGANNKKIKNHFKIDNTLLKYQMRLDYYNEKVLNENSYGKDIRIFNVTPLILHDFNENIFNIRKEYADKKAKIDSTLGSVPDIIKAVLCGAVYIFVGYKSLSGMIEIGKIVTCYGVVTKLITSVTNMSENIAYLISNNIYIQQEIKYLETPINIKNGNYSIKNINVYSSVFEFHNVSFKYPGSENFVLKNISFKINPNEKIAIVGLNGSGKTTLIKLLCRLYEPTEGYITLNGIDIKNFEYSEYLKLFGIVFQDYKLLAFSVAENVAANEIYDEDFIWKCLEMAGIKEYIDSLPKKINQCLYKYFEKDGIDISNGEEQKLAIARAIYKQAQLLILDEPTASLDPISENQIYEKFNTIIKDKTALFISHRLSSCKFCNKIIVLKKGEIVQMGTHEELVNHHNGEYYILWNIQAQYYSE